MTSGVRIPWPTARDVFDQHTAPLLRKHAEAICAAQTAETRELKTLYWVLGYRFNSLTAEILREKLDAWVAANFPDEVS